MLINYNYNWRIPGSNKNKQMTIKNGILTGIQTDQHDVTKFGRLASFPVWLTWMDMLSLYVGKKRTIYRRYLDINLKIIYVYKYIKIWTTIIYSVPVRFPIMMQFIKIFNVILVFQSFLFLLSCLTDIFLLCFNFCYNKIVSYLLFSLFSINIWDFFVTIL